MSQPIVKKFAGEGFLAEALQCCADYHKEGWAVWLMASAKAATVGCYPKGAEVVIDLAENAG